MQYTEVYVTPPLRVQVFSILSSARHLPSLRQIGEHLKDLNSIAGSTYQISEHLLAQGIGRSSVILDGLRIL